MDVIGGLTDTQAKVDAYLDRGNPKVCLIFSSES